jgi:hypothetical protein
LLTACLPPPRAAAPLPSIADRARRRPCSRPAGRAGQAGQQDRAELSQVQRKLDRIRKVLKNAKADAADLRRPRAGRPRTSAAAQAALAEASAASGPPRPAPGRRRSRPARAKLEVEAQQAVIDRRAYATYVNSGASTMLTLVVDADSVGDLLDRSKLLDNVAKAANTELQALVDAKVAADAARRGPWPPSGRPPRRRRGCATGPPSWPRSGPPGPPPRRRWSAGSARSSPARDGWRPARPGSSTASRPRRRARRRAAEAARRARLAAWPASGPRPHDPTVISSDDDGGYGGGPDTASYNYLTANTKRLYGLVERIFDVHSIGGWRAYGSVPGSDHPKGRAIDVMTWSNRSLGWRIANWAVANAGPSASST